MATSPNYAWAEPDNSSLVKNGASDIRTLGDAIDTSVWNIGFGQAGKNKIINGDFGVWQRGTSFTSVFNVVTSDRWFVGYDTGSPTQTVSRQSFTAGAAPVAGYENPFYFDWSVATPSTMTTRYLWTKIEDVRTFAGNTVTLSFWAKAASATTITSYLVQNFGSGGSGNVTSASQSNSLTTAWTRFTHTISVASISGKTIGTSSYLEADLQINSGSVQVSVFGVQLEYGSKATPFETATGTIQGELAACQRYYWRQTASTSYAGFAPYANAKATNQVSGIITNPVVMRVAPTSVEFSSVGLYDGNTTYAITSITLSFPSTLSSMMDWNVASGLTANRSYGLIANGSTSAYIGFVAEL